MRSVLLAVMSVCILSAQTFSNINLARVGNTTQSSANVVDPANNAFRINCITGCTGAGSGGTSLADLSTFTAGTTFLTPVGGVFNDSLAAVASGLAAAYRITANRAVHVNLRTASGVEIGTLASPLFASGTLTHNNAAPAANNFGVLPAIANAVAPTYVEGDQVLLSTSLTGSLRVSVPGGVSQGAPPWTQRIQDGVGATLATVTAGNALKVDGSAVTQPVSGTVTTTLGAINGACGSTNFSVAWMAVPTVNTSLPGATVTTCLTVLMVTNTTSATITLTVTDGQGTPITIIPGVTIAAHSGPIAYQFNGIAATTGLKWKASVTGLNGAAFGRQ